MGMRKTKKTPQIPIEEEYKTFIQNFLSWIYLQNPDFATYLTDEEITEYFFNGIFIPKHLNDFIHKNPFNILSKTHKYISKYKDKTSLFALKFSVVPIKEGNYKKPLCSKEN